MMAFFSVVNSFNAGELSPKMQGRPDVSQYAHGCRKLRNNLVTPYGTAERRPGTIFVAAASGNGAAVRLIPFVFSSRVTYLCEFGNLYIKIYRNDSFVVQVSSPYSSSDLGDLRWVQSADVMFICHPLHPIYELKRTAETVFTMSEMEMTYPAVLDDNLTDTTITPSARDGNITLTASADIFNALHVGSYWDIVYTRIENDIDFDFHADGVSGSIEVFGYWDLTTHGTWTGTLKIQRSFDDGATWSDYRTYTSANDQNVSSSGTEEAANVLYRLSMSDYIQSSTGTIRYCECLFSNPDYETVGVVRITSVTSATVAAATVIQKLGDTAATKEWNEGAWSDYRGYPRAIAFFEERLAFGGTEHQPNSLWLSRTNDWNSFKLGDLDDDAISLTLCSDTVNEIQWLCQHDSLIIGTTDSEWTLSASGSEDPLTPSNVKARPRSVFGSAPIAARKVGDVVLFVQRQGRKVREFLYSWEKNGYTSADLTELAEHISASGIAEIVLQQQPDTLLWCRLKNGTIAVLTYERDQQVVGWQILDLGGEVTSLAVMPGSEEDLVYASVLRNGALLIERFAPRSWDALADAVYSDSAVIAEGENLTRVSGLGHLEGMSVQILADGAEQDPKTVTGGVVTLDEPAQKVCVGVGFESLLSPMPIELDGQGGSTMLRKKTISELLVRVYGSIGGEIRVGEGGWREIISRSVTEDDVNSAIVPKDEVIQTNPAAGYGRETLIEIRQTGPLPLNVSSLSATVEIAE